MDGGWKDIAPLILFLKTAFFGLFLKLPVIAWSGKVPLYPRVCLRNTVMMEKCGKELCLCQIPASHTGCVLPAHRKWKAVSLNTRQRMTAHHTWRITSLGLKTHLWNCSTQKHDSWKQHSSISQHDSFFSGLKFGVVSGKRSECLAYYPSQIPFPAYIIFRLS